MFPTILIISAVLLIAVVAGLYFILADSSEGIRSHRHQAVSSNLRSLVASQRNIKGTNERQRNEKLALKAAAEADLSGKELKRVTKLSLKKKLKYAHLNLTPLQVRLIQVIVAVAPSVTLILSGDNLILGLLVFFVSPLLVNDFISLKMNQRFKAFDKDYATMLMSYVSLLKTGMNTMSGLEVAGEGLDEGSLIRAEIELLIERVKLGLSEEQAISLFGEDVYHMEIELFVQALVLSRRVGGNLSNTLERLAKQVRKRAQFRSQANAAVGMERGSLIAIMAIMTALMFYLYIKAPDLISLGFSDPLGWKITQGCIAIIVLGYYWSRKVSNIKV